MLLRGSGTGGELEGEGGVFGRMESGCDRSWPDERAFKMESFVRGTPSDDDEYAERNSFACHFGRTKDLFLRARAAHDDENFFSTARCFIVTFTRFFFAYSSFQKSFNCKSRYVKRLMQATNIVAYTKRLM